MFELLPRTPVRVFVLLEACNHGGLKQHFWVHSIRYHSKLWSQQRNFDCPSNWVN